MKKAFGKAWTHESHHGLNLGKLPLSSLYYTLKNGNETYIKMTKVPKITQF
jgi:hypothetical protein